ncbi:Flp pilus assembly protein CpaB [Bradyrhizobium diazoefficiens]|jgi:pilus assembly protein CpaB|uniref:Putative pilus assembly protein, RcpC/CpaB family n=1 Tax=Bradyrhizobium diazoefficiens SEMIA 5080 TaxID=754504 RepID=A0A837CK55_9BRAD|nr:Flp pilus assembly protein CpaB [Bradyrhizobium diazoefficiens]APO54458.1 Flp pilus assembly protein CpaB [Bradyrhizobium diazoefficiens]KGJ69033.1 putative pilus assembly protein, RcpC/CpaB family [Bradyrhizobium diazoefficiens SEMIA 5080]KOY10402.1 pilus assembly protein [Bradyrhizobium diazoefficiens]MCD9291265.1 Flp pilus assembly protein CpaB [Bradyrhizobium diazoefficiens]MCD9809271.1 Flp pilus assembly protein CpaB [Bradyrhizobium diazoefficiens]
MSSALRLSIILVLLLATTAFGLIAYNMNLPKQVPVAVMEQGPAPPSTVGYFVAARPLSKGTLAREEDFVVRSVPPERLPAGAILETSESKAGLPGSLVRKFVDVGSPITLQDVLRPRDRGFLASVLAPDSRAISIKVDEESGVSGLIRPGDYVDVLLTQVFEKADPARRAMSETVLANVRVIAIDQEIVQGGRTITSVAGKQAQTVSLELAPDQVKKVTVAKQIGTLSLAVRAAVEQWDTVDTGAMSSCDVSPEIARQNAIAGRTAAIVVHSGGQTKQYSVRRQDTGDGDTIVNCDGSEVSRRGATMVVQAGKLLEKR